MKTLAALPDTAAPILALAGVVGSQATDGDAAENAQLARAREFARPLLEPQALDTGENAFAHAEGVAQVLRSIGAAPAVQAAAYLVYAGDYLARPEESVGKAFGPSYAGLVVHTRRLVELQRAARRAPLGPGEKAAQVERVRKMLLAFSRDLRVVLLRLTSRLQTLRWYAARHAPCPGELAQEAMDVFAPLASRLGIWQVKWELEDLAFRFLRPDDYRRVASQLDERRVERERDVEAMREAVQSLLRQSGLRAEVQGRPKHLHSIWKKMQGKGLDFAKVFDLRALRVIVDDVPDCYAALAALQQRFAPVAGEFDDYIARPKANGYQSLHTVVRSDDGRPLEVQIRTRAMHEHAEFGVAAHWAYKEAGARGYGGVEAAGDFEQRVAEARKAVLRQLLAWERDVAEPQGSPSFDDRIYVFTPQATLVELPAGATAVDFAYHVHSELGHRCRGARVDGALLPLNTPLANGQTVEVVAAREGGPSRDWLNPDLGYLRSARSRAKVRAWFNAQALAETVARGREAVERLLQREGRTAIKLEHLAERLGFSSADALFEVVGKDEYSLRHIEQLLRPAGAPPEDAAEQVPLQRARSGGGRGGVLVVGIDSLLTTLARCCRPAPPDDIVGFVTRGRGVAIHRRGCSNLRQMVARSPDRMIDVTWSAAREGDRQLYPLDVQVEAGDRPGLLRDVSDVFSKHRMNVTAAQTQALVDGQGRRIRLALTVELADAAQLPTVLTQVARLPGVRHARRL